MAAAELESDRLPEEALPRTNVFLNSYQQPENKLTYNFLCLLEHLEIHTAMKLLLLSGFPEINANSLRISLLHGGLAGNPDGCITILMPSSEKIEMFFENKTWRRKLDISQILRHIKARMHPRERQYLLVISADPRDEDRIREIGDGRLFFTTWNRILEYAQIASPISPSDLWLLRQFAEYLSSSEEAWRAQMLSKECIDAHAKFLAYKENDQKFMTDSRKLVEGLRESLLPKFREEIADGATCSRYGRICVETTLKTAPYGQSIVFGIYAEAQDGIKFERPHIPEFVVFWMMEPANRELLSAVPKIGEALENLRERGFKLNFPRNIVRNSWHVVYWQRSMNEFIGQEVDQLQDLFSERLHALMQSQFYKLARDAEPC